MNQRKQPKKSKRMPTYSADAMVVHLVSGLLLIALGVLIFLAVAVRMQGDVFTGLRNVCAGLAGSLAILMPVFPIWGGVLVVMSTQRKAPVRPFLLACGLYLLLLACANLLTFTGVPSRSLMDYYAATNATSRGFDMYLARGYANGVDRGIGGGLLGMVPAWPLWAVMGPILAAVVCIVLGIVDVMFLTRFDARRAFARLKARRDSARAEDARRQEHLRQQELQWQQQQAMQAQARAAQAQQQAWQPQQPVYGQPYGAQAYPNQAQQAPVYDYNAPLPQAGQQQDAMPIGFQPTEEELHGAMKPTRSLRERLFGNNDRPTEQPEKPARARRKRLFDEDDPAELPEQPARPARSSRTRGQTVREQVAASVQQYTAPVQQQPYSEPAAQSMQYTAPVQQQPYSEPAAQPMQYTAPVQSVPAYTAPIAPQAEPQPAAPSDWQRQIDERLAAMNTPAQDEPRPKARSKRSASWEEGSSAKRTASWRTPDDEPQPKKPAVQKPKASWSDDDQRPPWEDPIETPAAPVVPVMQTAAPAGAWKPDLDLAPTKEGAETLGGLIDDELPEIPYIYPDLDLLKLPDLQTGISPEEDALRSQRLEDTLASFKVTAKVRHVTHGPAISRFELELAQGIKVNKVTDLAQNIAMNMEVKSVRIEAPIPGKSLVGVEVPNRKTATVTLREIMESEPMRNAKSPLVVALGKDIAGTPIVCDLARMPHLLIAGATGSGKSVCINTMINSLLYRCSPKEVRMILVDPKVVELQCYNSIPHLLIPVVSDPHKAAGALAWAVAEMMDRYKKFQIKGVRAIDGYNAALNEGEEHMPRIVIIIDELADLMMTCKRDVEDHICRLAQLARAAGIHLVVATQRPSVDVITGLIKANIPSRIAFKVSSFIDSRTILDKMGAEQLLGWGDMLYQPTGEFTPIRIQGCFLSDAEVNRITDFIRENSPAQYDPNVIEELERLTSDSDGSGMPDMSEVTDPTGSGDGSLLAQCIEMAVNDGQVSTSLIQRRLKVGYARAGRLVDEMEKRGIVSQKDGAKPRMCLLSREEFERMKETGELDV